MILLALGMVLGSGASANEYGSDIGVVLALIWSVYMILCHMKWGQSLGKALFRVQVLDREAMNPPSVGWAMLRETRTLVPATWGVIYITAAEPSLGYISAGVFVAWWCFTLVDIAMFLWSREGRSLHDWIGRTLVVRTPTPRVIV